VATVSRPFTPCTSLPTVSHTHDREVRPYRPQTHPSRPRTRHSIPVHRKPGLDPFSMCCRQNRLIVRSEMNRPFGSGK
jgi:hypothetical protein